MKKINLETIAKMVAECGITTDELTAAISIICRPMKSAKGQMRKYGVIENAKKSNKKENE